MLRLLLWHEDTRDPQALAAATKIGDLLCAKFVGTGRRVVDTGSPEMNQAVAHGLALLYRHTGDPKHLALARQVVDELAMKTPDGALAGDYLRSALAGKEFFQCPRPRWESLHPLLGLAELFWLTGDKDCRKAFEHIWWSIAKLDRHNTGGFSSGEQAQGNPYHKGAIETCCTIAWAAPSVEMLRMTSDSIVADELGLSTLNAIFGYDPSQGLPFSWEYKGLGPGRHTVRITVMDRRHKDSKGNFTNITALVRPDEAVAAVLSFDARTTGARLLQADGPQAPILLVEARNTSRGSRSTTWRPHRSRRPIRCGAADLSWRSSGVFMGTETALAASRTRVYPRSWAF